MRGYDWKTGVRGQKQNTEKSNYFDGKTQKFFD